MINQATIRKLSIIIFRSSNEPRKRSNHLDVTLNLDEEEKYMLQSNEQGKADAQLLNRLDSFSIKFLPKFK